MCKAGMRMYEGLACVRVRTLKCQSKSRLCVVDGGKDMIHERRRRLMLQQLLMMENIRSRRRRLHCSGRDVYCSGRDVYCSGRDVYCSGRDVYCSGRGYSIASSDRRLPMRHVLRPLLADARHWTMLTCLPPLTLSLAAAPWYSTLLAAVFVNMETFLHVVKFLGQNGRNTGSALVTLNGRGMRRSF